jgi:hypothetical protein
LIMADKGELHNLIMCIPLYLVVARIYLKELSF